MATHFHMTFCWRSVRCELIVKPGSHCHDLAGNCNELPWSCHKEFLHEWWRKILLESAYFFRGKNRDESQQLTNAISDRMPRCRGEPSRTISMQNEAWPITTTQNDTQNIVIGVYNNAVRINSFWPSDAIWRHRSGSTLAQVMACCLTAPSHYLNQCWLIISKVQWRSSDRNFTKYTIAIDHWV